MSKAKRKVEEIQQDQSNLAKQAGATRKGALVYWWLTGIMSHIEDVKALYDKHGLDWERWGPPEQKATAAFRKTIRVVSGDLNQKGRDTAYLIRVIDTTEEYLLYGVVREDRLKANEDLAHACEAKIKLKREECKVVTSKDNGTDGYQVAQKVKDLFDIMFCHMIVQDFSRLLTRNIKLMQSVSIRPTGAVYFVPEGYRDVLDKMRAVLEDVPGDSHLCCIDIWGSQPDLARDTKIALEQELKDLQKEIEVFKTRAPRQDALKNRLAEFKELKEKGRMFAEVLEFNSKDILAGLDECNTAVVAMIDGGHFLGSDQSKATTSTKQIRKVVEVQEAEEQEAEEQEQEPKKVAKKKASKRVSTIVAEKHKAAKKVAKKKGKKVA